MEVRPSDPMSQLVRGEVRHATVRPLDVSGISSVLTGLVGWAVAFVVLLVFFRDDLRHAGNEWWLWVPVTGFGIGLLGLWYCRRRWAAIRRDRDAATGQLSDGSRSS